MAAARCGELIGRPGPSSRPCEPAIGHRPCRRGAMAEREQAPAIGAELEVRDAVAFFARPQQAGNGRRLEPTRPRINASPAASLSRNAIGREQDCAGAAPSGAARELPLRPRGERGPERRCVAAASWRCHSATTLRPTARRRKSSDEHPVALALRRRGGRRPRSHVARRHRRRSGLADQPSLGGFERGAAQQVGTAGGRPATARPTRRGACARAPTRCRCAPRGAARRRQRPSSVARRNRKLSRATAGVTSRRGVAHHHGHDALARSSSARSTSRCTSGETAESGEGRTRTRRRRGSSRRPLAPRLGRRDVLASAAPRCPRRPPGPARFEPPRPRRGASRRRRP